MASGILPEDQTPDINRRKESGTAMDMTSMMKFAATAALSLALATPALAADDARARELINSLGCKGCHQLDGEGGTLGPAFKGVGSRLKEKDIREQLVNPKGKNPNTMMPAFANLPEKDLKVLVDYLSGLK
jgi:ubiquinol-cytochrome c reductase cytochrome b subunit